MCHNKRPSSTRSINSNTDPVKLDLRSKCLLSQENGCVNLQTPLPCGNCFASAGVGTKLEETDRIKRNIEIFPTPLSCGNYFASAGKLLRQLMQNRHYQQKTKEIDKVKSMKRLQKILPTPSLCGNNFAELPQQSTQAAEKPASKINLDIFVCVQMISIFKLEFSIHMY